jgi:hypothetical protein
MSNLINPVPVAEYEPPQIPTLADIKDKKAFLKRLPRRWQKSAAVLACAGMVGVWTHPAFSMNAAQPEVPEPQPEVVGLNRSSTIITRNVVDEWCLNCRETKPLQITRLTEVGSTTATIRQATPKSRRDECWRSKWIRTTARHIGHSHPMDVFPSHFELYHFHFGGTGHAFYFARLSEAEALNIIRAHLEDAGLRFFHAPNGSLFDHQLNVSVSVSVSSNSDHNADTHEVRINGNNAVITNPMRVMSVASGPVQHSSEIRSQVDAFIAHLREEGVIPPEV